MYNAAFSEICQLTQNFLVALGQLHASISPDIGTANTETARSRNLSVQAYLSIQALDTQESVVQLQQQFQSIITTFESAHVDPQIAQRVRPFLTEGHRRLRLAGVEAMRLRTAKQPATVEKQRSLIQAHLDHLQQFAQAIADEVCPDPSGEMPRALP